MPEDRSQQELHDALSELNGREKDIARGLFDRFGSPEGEAALAGIREFQQRLQLATGDLGGLEPTRSFDVAETGAHQFLEVLSWHPGFSEERAFDVGISAFGGGDELEPALEPALLELRRQSVTCLAAGALALGHVERPDDDRSLDALLQIAVSAGSVDAILRRALAGLVDPLWDPTDDDLDRFPGGLMDLQSLVRKGCISEIRNALGALGQTVQAGLEAAKVFYNAFATGITAIVPNTGCAGDHVKIRGSGLPTPQLGNVDVYFPRSSGGCARSPAVTWTSTMEIDAEVPGDVGVGYVGFVQAFGAAPQTGGEVGSPGQLADVLEHCIGLAAAGVAAKLRNTSVAFGAQPVPCPRALPNDENHFTGGPPRIVSFTADAGAKTVELKPGDPITLSWTVKYATAVRIARVSAGGTRNQLPEITAALNSASGTIAVPAVRGTYFWEGVYELRAVNACNQTAPVTARVHVTMRPPRTAFLWGVGTAAHQVEGNLTNNDWELFTTDPTIGARVTAHGNLGSPPQNFTLRPAGDGLRHASLAALGEDLERARALGANAYRFSVEWSRVQPTPGPLLKNVFDNYYIPVVNAVWSRGMTPVVTLNHLTLPLWVCTPPTTTTLLGEADRADTGFQASLRGWENLQTVTAFLDFVELAVTKLAPSGVHHWITLNEPVGSMVMVGYVAGVWPPGLSLDPWTRAIYGNLLRAHVQAYDLIHSLDPNAKVSIAHNMTACKVLPGPDPFGANVAARNQLDYFYHWHFLDAVTSGSVDVNLARRPQDRKLQDSNQFFGIPTADWTSKLDFVGVNYYRSFYVEHSEGLSLAGLGFAGGKPHDNAGPSNLLTDLGWEVNPSGLYDVVKRIHDDYGLPVLITESGMSEIRDLNRAPHLVAHLEQLQRAMADGVDVLGYMYWSLVDNFEWDYNYEPRGRFGLYTVDRNQPGPTGVPLLLRRLTDGALAYQHFTAHGTLSPTALALARNRFGSVSAAGNAVVAPTKSNGALWDGTGSSGIRLALYVAELNPSPPAGTSQWIGMIFDYAKGRWVKLDDITWDPTTATLVLYHRPASGVPEREYVGTRTGDQITGTFSEGNQTVPWTVNRVWAHGFWTSGSTVPQYVSFALNATGKWEWGGTAPDPWQGKTLPTPGPGNAARWNTWPVVVSGTTINFPAGSNAVLSGTTMQGTSGNQTWVATRATDDVPFGK